MPATGTPLQVTVGWFKAINAQDAQLATSYFTGDARYMMEWGPASDWSTFRSFRCMTVSATPTNAEVHCSFNESASPSEGNPASGWSVDLRHGPEGWLIDNYGQG